MGNLDNSPTIQITGTIMVIAIIVLFLVVVFVLFLHLYARRFWRQIDEPPPPPPYATRRRRRRPLVISSGQEIPTRTGLDIAVLRRLPVVMVQYNKDSKQGGLECAVCLSEIEEGEKARLLPKCNHWFHVDCIDMWFKSHSTCPLCRSKVVGSSPDDDDDHGEEEEDSLEVSGGGQSLEEALASSGYSLESAASFPTNVLVWGDETQVSTNGGGGGGEGNPGNLPLPCRSGSFRASSSTSLEVVRRRDEILVIDIPNQIGEDLAEEDESDKSPVPRRLRSFRRMLSRERRVAPSGSSSSDEV